MEQNKDQSGAAVRGEAVADINFLCSTMDAQVWATEFCKLNNASDHEMILGWFANAIMAGFDEANRRSARAADAPSEPSDDEIVAIARQAIRDGSATWDHFQKDDAGKFTVPVLDPKDFMLVRAVLAAVKSRAADALDSQPTEPTGYVRISELKKLESNRVAGVGMMVQKEGGDGWTPIYASSQPTDGDGCDECRHTYCLNGEICRHCGDVNGTQGWKSGRQPTDGGVRNG